VGAWLVAAGIGLGASVALCTGSGCGSSGNRGSAGDSAAGGADGSGGSSGSGGSGGSTGCAAYPHAAFCDDFEDETDASFATNWPGVPYSEAQFVRPVVITSPSAYSPTHVLHADAEFVADAGSAGQRFSLIGRNLPTLLPTQSVSVGFSVRVVSFTPAEGGYESGPSPDFQVSFYSPQPGIVPSCLVEFQGLDPTHYLVNMCGQQGPNGEPTTSFAFVPGTWQRITVSASFGPTEAGTGTVTLAVDGSPIKSVPLSTGTATGVSSYTGTLSLGSFGYDETPSMVLDLDDVVIEQM